MKIFILFLLVIYTKAYAANFHIYPNNNESVVRAILKEHDPKSNIRDVFTKLEKRLLKDERVNTHLLNVNTKLNITKLKSLFPKLKIEKQSIISINSLDYSPTQWYLKNTGELFTKWTSDIDSIQIQAVAFEDINTPLQENLKEVLIAVIDSGVDTQHPDLKNKIYNNPLECSNLVKYKDCLKEQKDKNICHERYAKTDSNNNGYPLDCQGWSLTNNSYPGVNLSGNPEVDDKNGHGTHVAGIIAAEHNKMGIDGIVKNVKILPIQVALSSSETDPIENIAKGVLYAIKSNVDIINLSVGWRFQFDSTLMREMVELANSKNILVVVAAGNNGHEDVSYPCAYKDVICVGAHDQTGAISKYSNSGVQVDILAPGDDILSTWPTSKRSKAFTRDNNFELLSGTSQAAPIISGALGLMIASGHAPQHARVKILQSTRTETKPVNVRNGNIDIKDALKSKVRSYIYPLNKEPYLVKYKESNNHKFLLKLKNYGETIQNSTIRISSPKDHEYRVVTPQINIPIFQNKEEKEFSIQFTTNSKSQSELYFDLEITTNNILKRYRLKAQFIRVITPELMANDLETVNVIDPLAQDINIKAFKNYTESTQVDFFIQRFDNLQNKVSVLKKTKDGYKQSKEISIKEKNPTFLSFSKIDIDIDDKDDYVISYIFTNSENMKITKFLILDHKLRLKRFLISPRNTFKNDITHMPSKFKWIKKGNVMAPAWIGFGLNATPVFIDPWRPKPKLEKNYFYYLTSNGLQNFNFPEDEIVLHTLYSPLNENNNHSVKVITSKGFGFFKEFNLYNVDKKPKLISLLKMQDYLDIFNLKAIPFDNTTHSATFHESTIDGGQNILSLNMTKNELEYNFTKLNSPILNESIFYINKNTNDSIFFQTEFKLGHYDTNSKQYKFRNSKVDIKRRRYIPLTHTSGLYLPASEAPGLTGELLHINDTGEFVSSSKHRTIAVQGCEEIGLISTQTKDLIGFYCFDSSKIKLLEIGR
jgi:subtilisin family serine protease